MYRVDVFQFLFVDKGVIAERGYKEEYGREDFDDKYLASDWYVKYNSNVMDVWLSFQSVKMKSCVTFTRCKAFQKEIMHVKKKKFS